VDCSDTQLPLHGGYEGRTLEECASKGLKGSGELCFAPRNLVMQSNNTNVFFSSSLLRLYKPCSAINANDQTASHFRVKGATVASLLNSALELVRGSLDEYGTNHLKIRFTHATTSWLEGLEGLSRLITPELI
jgi:hypothetical protein